MACDGPMPLVDKHRYVVNHGDRVLCIHGGGGNGSAQLNIDVWGPAGHINFRLETSTWTDEIRPLIALLESLGVSP